jgi:hypothetical protein
MHDLLFGSLGPLLGIPKLHPWQVFGAVLVFAQFGILVLHMMFGAKGSSRGGDGGDIGGWDFGDGDGGGD